MKQSLHCIVWSILCLGMLALPGCKADVDLEHIDQRIDAQMGLALPVGQMRFTINDFIGGGQIGKLYTDPDGVFHYMDTLQLGKQDFHPLDLSQFLGDKSDHFGVLKQIEGKLVIEDGYVIGNGEPVTLHFPMSFKFQGINHDPQDERVDSVIVQESKFTSRVNTRNFDLPWNYINKVEMALGEQFRREGSNTFTVYSDESGATYGYNMYIPIYVDRFVLNLMRDETQVPSMDNVVDTCSFEILFTFTIPDGERVKVGDDAAYVYDLHSEFVDFDAAWGWFTPNKEMSYNDTVDLDSTWRSLAALQTVELKLMEPEVQLSVTHHVSAPVRIFIDGLSAKDKQGQQTWATWNGSRSHDFCLENVLDPYSDFLDSVSNTLLLNYTDSLGHIDNLFTIQPYWLYYSLRVKIDTVNAERYYPWKQHRITNNTAVCGTAMLDVPFKLNEGSKVQVKTKIKDIQFDRLSLDSLLKNVKEVEKGKAKSLKLFIGLDNSLPFAAKTNVCFLAPDSSVVDLKLVAGQEDNTIVLPAPKMHIENGKKYATVDEPSHTVVMVDVAENQFDMLTQCRHLQLMVDLGDCPAPCAIDTAASIVAEVGVAASVEAIINLNKTK